MNRNCDIAGASPSGLKPRACGCVEQLVYDEPDFGERGGWRSSVNPEMFRRCKTHEAEYFEQQLAKNQKEAALKTFQDAYGFRPFEIRIKLAALVEKKKAIEEEIRTFEDLEQRFGSLK